MRERLVRKLLAELTGWAWRSGVLSAILELNGHEHSLGVMVSAGKEREALRLQAGSRGRNSPLTGSYRGCSSGEMR